MPSNSPQESLERLTSYARWLDSPGAEISPYESVVDEDGKVSRAEDIRELAGEVATLRLENDTLRSSEAWAIRRLNDGEAKLSALSGAASDLIKAKSSTFKSRNGREMGVEADDGEKCWIIHSDQVTALESALASLDSTVPAGEEQHLCAHCGAFVDEIALPAEGEGKADRPIMQSVMDRGGLPNRFKPGHPDAYLNALLDYTSGFYSAATACGMKAGPAADAMQHVERAARGLHALAAPSQEDREARREKIAGIIEDAISAVVGLDIPIHAARNAAVNEILALKDEGADG